MKRLGVVTISLCVVLAVLCSVAVARGRALLPEPSTMQAAGLEVCNASPCFFGLIPGETSWVDSLNLMGKLGRIEQEEYCKRIVFGTDPTDDVDICATDISDINAAKLGTITVGTTEQYPPSLSLGAIIQRFGAPCNVTGQSWEIAPTINPTFVARGFILNYPKLIVNVVVVGERLEMNATVSQVTLFDPRDPDPEWRRCDRSNVPEGYTATSWRGFTRRERYVDVP